MTASPWQSEALDLDAYLLRIGYGGPVEPTYAVLRALHRAHLAAVPFENLDIILGRGIAVDLASVQAKLVEARRGGYCYEHGTLFAAALDRVGFTVDRLLARTGDPLVEPRPRSHLTLRVAGEEGVWLADVGFGSGLLEPIPWRQTDPVQQGAWRYRLTVGADGAWRLGEDDGAGWTTIQTIPEDPVYFIDVERMNWTTSTHPRSPFATRPVCVAKDEVRVKRLLGRTFSVEAPGRPVETAELDGPAWAAALGAEFGIPLSAAEIAALQERTRPTAP